MHWLGRFFVFFKEEMMCRRPTTKEKQVVSLGKNVTV
jgi:hypothetical protein